MSKIAIVTDTNSGITQEEAKKLGVYLLAMPFIVDGKEYFEGVTCTYEKFFEMLGSGSDVSTSQPSPESLTSLWNKVLETNDYIIHIPMSSALSGSCGTAKALAADYDGKVVVVDNKRISISQRQSVLDALTLIAQGLSAADICAKLEETAFNSSIYLAVNTLELLKKSGRVTAAGAAVASILGIKPVLQIQGEKLDAYAKARGMANAQKTMLAAIEKDLETRFKCKNIRIDLAYSGDIGPANEWKKIVRKHFGDKTIQMYKLPVSICCHVGAGVCAIAVLECI
ncbi:MAG: DegV family protein [Oscillospiraceae bacterium]|nr:DegV family protein [Oscillospiraceae bacterium]